jgi:hypothetical protein
VTSNLSCIGLGVADTAELENLFRRVIPTADELGRVGALRVLRWEDPSGARLVLGVADDGTVPDLLPSFAGMARTRGQRWFLSTAPIIPYLSPKTSPSPQCLWMPVGAREPLVHKGNRPASTSCRQAPNALLSLS